MKLLLPSSLFACCFVSLTSAWWDNGHMMTAEIARQQLTQDEIDTLNQVLADWNEDFPTTSDVVQSAVWPDVIKCTEPSSFCRKPNPDALGQFDSWHFDDQPWNRDNLKQLPPEAALWSDNPSGSWMLTQATKTFNITTTRFAFNLFLRFVIHVIGDLHQPLHAVSGYFNDTTYGYLPEGDRGGNLIYINVPQWDGIQNLHSFWDAAGGAFQNNHPLDDQQKQDLVANASKIISEFPKNSSVFAGRYNPSEIDGCWGSRDHCASVYLRWANSSYELAVTKVYPNVSNHGGLSPEYIENAQVLCRSQLALGGYRLGDVLKRAAAEMQTLPTRTTKSHDYELNTLAVILLAGLCFVTCLCVLLLVVVVRTRGKGGAAVNDSYAAFTGTK